VKKEFFAHAPLLLKTRNKYQIRTQRLRIPFEEPAQTMAEPMVIDGGIASLEQSQHYPLAGRSQFNPPSPPTQTQASDSPVSIQGDDSDPAVSILQSIKAYMIPGKEDEVSRLLRELRVIVATVAITTAATSP
jgi:hypothetical protein